MPEKKSLAVGERQKKIIFPTLAAGVLLACLCFIVHDSIMKLGRLEKELSEANRMQKAIAKLRDSKTKEQNLLKMFPGVQQKDDIMKEIAGWGRREGLEITQIEPKEEILPNTNFMQLSLTLTGNGSFLPITKFLERLEASSYFILVSNLQLQGFEPQRARSVRGERNELGERSFKVTVNVFLNQ